MNATSRSSRWSNTLAFELAGRIATRRDVGLEREGATENSPNYQSLRIITAFGRHSSQRHEHARHEIAAISRSRYRDRSGGKQSSHVDTDDAKRPCAIVPLKPNELSALEIAGLSAPDSTGIESGPHCTWPRR